MNTAYLRYNINTKTDFYRPEIEALSGLLEATRKTFTLVKDNSMRFIKDLGMKFSTAIAKKRVRYGLYQCPICSKEFESRTYGVTAGRTTKCRGCHSIKHGDHKTRLYSIWRAMRHRVSKTDKETRVIYLDKGIIVCDEWSDYLTFKNWSLSNGYSDTLSIDRINNDGNYEPSNCRWTTPIVQSRNTRLLLCSNTSGYRGVSFYKITNRWKSYIKVNSIMKHLGYFQYPWTAALVRDSYVINNNFEHTLNYTIEGGY